MWKKMCLRQMLYIPVLEMSWRKSSMSWKIEEALTMWPEGTGCTCLHDIRYIRQWILTYTQEEREREKAHQTAEWRKPTTATGTAVKISNKWNLTKKPVWLCKIYAKNMIIIFFSVWAIKSAILYFTVHNISCIMEYMPFECFKKINK